MADVFVLNKALEEIGHGKEVAIVTITKAFGSTPRGVGSMMLVLKDGKTYGTYGTVGGGRLEKEIIDRTLEALNKGESISIDLPLEQQGVDMICGGEVSVFIDICKKRPKLLIVGGGHVGNAIYNIASLLDFHIAIFEDRKEFLTKERFPQANELILGDIKTNLENYSIDEDTYIIIVTRGHEYDEESLEAVIDRGARYIGLMGSKNKVDIMLDELEEKGIDEKLLEKVYTPIGLDIGDETPEEIAISIMSEVLLIKNKGSLSHLRITKKD